MTFNPKTFEGMSKVNHPSSSYNNLECGYCGKSVSAHIVATYSVSNGRLIWWEMCPSCSYGSVRDSEGHVYPTKKFGDHLQGLPGNIEEAYDEAGNCFSVKAYSACTLICRKILMQIAVDKGDTTNKKFVEYIDYLKNEGYITRVMSDWVNKIREAGNESTHEIPAASEEKAKSILLFTVQLLRNVYEMKFIADTQLGPSTQTPP